MCVYTWSDCSSRLAIVTFYLSEIISLYFQEQIMLQWVYGESQEGYDELTEDSSMIPDTLNAMEMI